MDLVSIGRLNGGPDLPRMRVRRSSTRSSPIPQPVFKPYRIRPRHYLPEEERHRGVLDGDHKSPMSDRTDLAVDLHRRRPIAFRIVKFEALHHPLAVAIGEAASDMPRIQRSARQGCNRPALLGKCLYTDDTRLFPKTRHLSIRWKPANSRSQKSFVQRLQPLFGRSFGEPKSIFAARHIHDVHCEVTRIKSRICVYLLLPRWLIRHGNIIQLVIRARPLLAPARWTDGRRSRTNTAEPYQACERCVRTRARSRAPLSMMTKADLQRTYLN